MQELHCRPLFQANSLLSRAEPSCQKLMDSEFDNHQLKHLLHKSLDKNHDSTELWPKNNTDSNKPKKQDLFSSEIFKTGNFQILGIFGIGIMGMMLLISMASKFMKIYKE
ncbi:MAG: hypothetical protein RLZZ361_95 [Cyanobacteriota bacterium]|jgi:hypothetical protein